MVPLAITVGALGSLMVVEIIWLGRCALQMVDFAADPVGTGDVGAFEFPKWDIFLLTKRIKGTKGRISTHIQAEKLMYKTVWLVRGSFLTGAAIVGCGIWLAASVN